MDKKYNIFAFVNVNTKKGILQLIYKLKDSNIDFLRDVDDLESIVFYYEVYNDPKLSRFSNTYYFGKKIDSNHCMSNNGNVYEIIRSDVIVQNIDGIKLRKMI